MAKSSTVALSQDELKKQAAHRAVEYAKSGMVLGLGTGSTTAFAIDRIGELMKKGELKDIVGVPTSIKSYEQASGNLAATYSSCTWSVADLDMQVIKRTPSNCMPASSMGLA